MGFKRHTSTRIIDCFKQDKRGKCFHFPPSTIPVGKVIPQWVAPQQSPSPFDFTGIKNFIIFENE
jgi:hypothetical protein